MEKRFVYADNAATTPMSETAFNAMKPWLTENYGNPSSLYRIGRAAKEALNDARTARSAPSGAPCRRLTASL